MTDMYEPHEREAGHDEVLTPEHAEVREAPSDYEFADEHSATAEQSEEQDTTVSTANPKGRSPLLPITAAVVGVALLGGVAWWQFGGSHANTAPPMMTASMAPIPTTPPATEAAPPPPPAQPITQTVDATQAPQPAMAPAPSVPAPVPAPAPAMPVLNAPAAVPVTPIVTPAPVAAVPVVAAPDARIDALSAHMDDLQKSLDQVTQQLGQVNTMVVANASNAPAVNTPSTQDLQNRIDALEQQIAQLQHHGSSTHNAPSLSSPAAMPDQGIVAMPDSNPVKVTHHHAKKVQPAPKVAATKKPAAPATSWVLRAASPGQAWVSSSATSTDLKQVHVGDTVEGIGRISSINQINGNWVVAGSKGTLQ